MGCQILKNRRNLEEIACCSFETFLALLSPQLVASYLNHEQGGHFLTDFYTPLSHSLIFESIFFLGQFQCKEIQHTFDRCSTIGFINVSDLSIVGKKSIAKRVS